MLYAAWRGNCAVLPESFASCDKTFSISAAVEADVLLFSSNLYAKNLATSG